MSKDRFSNYREIEARFDSTATCGHQVRKGDRIGFNGRIKPAGVQCPACWAKWATENSEADAVEAGYLPSCY